VEELSQETRLLVLCGRYEGFDERVSEILEPDEVSIGDYILGGGEVAAMVVMEAVVRLVPGVVGAPGSVAEDSFGAGLLDHPSYTRPPDVEGRPVPDVLRSGNHGKIARWRLERAVESTVTRRPDLIIENWDRYPAEVRRLIRRYAPGLDPERASTAHTD
jgi:tRNA (guanine37-N1)-methyltransferase